MKKLLLLLVIVTLPCCAQVNTLKFWHRVAHVALTMGCVSSAGDGAATDIAVHGVGGFHETNHWLLTNGQLNDRKLWGYKALVCGGGWAIDQLGDHKFAPQYRDTAAIAIGTVTSVGFILLDIQDTQMLLNRGRK